ncbi:LacI family DNA-binding transcriptional regulator [Acidisoma silvae]|uniref:LacI family DNA-binding transcriptional regulator n=1 Tax=Acidisoma silvae TaxID=2802396 RepID=A0A963YTR2_9PROT|nr:LacI family DNA-binding transcriptional regulator [Acidisoma silvae]MCB8876895.1 LacI family DNA-binding transcriptional regulator [Acidisoma silvae]
MDQPTTGRGMTRRTTLTEVAQQAGVSEITVSRVLRNSGPIAPATRERVMEAVRALGYVPNRVAGTLASSGSNLVGIVLPSLANIVFPEVLRGAAGPLAKMGYQPVIAVTEYDPAREEALIESLLAWRPAGLMVTGLEHTPRAEAMLRNAGIRVAELMDSDGAGIDIIVGFSNVDAGRIAARHLLSRGYRRFGYVGHGGGATIGKDLRAEKRWSGFAMTLKEAGYAVSDKEIVDAPSSVAAGRYGLAELLARSPGLDAVYLSNDDMALGGYFHCLSQGISIPGQLALFGHNALDVGQVAPQPLSTVRTPRLKIGEIGAKLVCGDAPPQTVDVGIELIEGATA